MSTRRERDRKAAKAILIALPVLALIGIYAMYKPVLDKDPASNLGYMAWKWNLRGFDRKFIFMLFRDSAGQQRFVGKPIEQFTAETGIELTDGTKYGTGMYRGWVQELIREQTPGVTFHWLDDENIQSSGYCIIARAGRFEKLRYIKGA